MKHKIIRINSISEVDTAKTTVYDLNNRYIDQSGNMYGLKYNRMNRKVEIIKLVRASLKDSSLYHQKMMMEKIQKTKKHAQDSEYPDDTPEFAAESFNTEQFVEEGFSLLMTHRERLKGIVMNLTNSNIFPKESKAENIELENIFRNIEIEAMQTLDKLENYRKELTNYPRSVSYYHAKLNHTGRSIIEMLSGDKVKTMKFIYFHEMQSGMVHIYRNLYKIIKDLIRVVSKKNIDDIPYLAQSEKQSFLDAEISIYNTNDEIEKMLDDLEMLGNKINNPDEL